MKYTITGAAGKISGLLAKNLLSAGHEVKVIGRNAANLQPLVAAGAEAAIGSIEDADFLKAAFRSADAVYTMCPFHLSIKNVLGYHVLLGRNFSNAIRANNIRYVVNLSSIGAHLESGTGPVSGVHVVENALNQLEDVNIKHMRPAYFYQNLFSYIPLLLNAGILGNNFIKKSKEFPMSDPLDIAAVIAEHLINLDFTGHSYRYIVSDETGTDELADQIGNAIGQPGLKWTKFSDEQVFENLTRAGLSNVIAKTYVELGNAINSGIAFEDYQSTVNKQFGNVKLTHFMNVFSSVYNEMSHEK